MKKLVYKLMFKVCPWLFVKMSFDIIIHPYLKERLICLILGHKWESVDLPSSDATVVTTYGHSRCARCPAFRVLHRFESGLKWVIINNKFVHLYTDGKFV